MQAVWWIIFGISVVVYILLAGFVVPKIFFKAGCEISFSYDRGLQNFQEKNGRSIVYEPKPEYRKYISQYILSERKDEKVIICKIKESISYIDYDLVLFNSKDKVFDVINVKESIEKTGYTNTVELPPSTAYVTLIINYIDNINIDNGMINKVSNRRLALFAAAACALSVLEVFCAKLCLANIFGDVFYGDFMMSAVSILTTFGIGIAVALINLAAAFVYLKYRNKKYAESREPI